MKQSPINTLLLAVPLVLVMALVPVQAETGPDTVEIDAMVSYYGPVSFDHAMHVDLTERNCAECHHHTTGTPPTDQRCLKCHKGGEEGDSMACGDCHSRKPFEASSLAALAADPGLYHIDKPGLKGAFHRNCLGCHQEMGGPVGCQDCHQRNESGDAFFHAGKFAPPLAGKGQGH